MIPVSGTSGDPTRPRDWERVAATDVDKMPHAPSRAKRGRSPRFVASRDGAGQARRFRLGADKPRRSTSTLRSWPLVSTTTAWRGCHGSVTARRRAETRPSRRIAGRRQHGRARAACWSCSTCLLGRYPQSPHGRDGFRLPGLRQALGGARALETANRERYVPPRAAVDTSDSGEDGDNAPKQPTNDAPAA